MSEMQYFHRFHTGNDSFSTSTLLFFLYLQPSMIDNNINQSASFKRLMYSVMNDEFENN